MARIKKENEEVLELPEVELEAEVTEEEYTGYTEVVKEVKTVFRYIAATGGRAPDGAWLVEQVDAYIGMFLNDGWSLLNTHCTGMEARGDSGQLVLGMVYVLVR